MFIKGLDNGGVLLIFLYFVFVNEFLYELEDCNLILLKCVLDFKYVSFMLVDDIFCIVIFLVNF